MTGKKTNLENRARMLIRLRAEVVGPDPSGIPVEITDNQTTTWAEFRTARRQVNGEEIVWQDPPIKRYGAGILFPQGTDEDLIEGAVGAQGKEASDSQESPPDVDPHDGAPDEEDVSAVAAPDDSAEEESVTLANSFRPSAIGLSFLANLAVERAGVAIELASVGRISSDQTVEGACGTYKQVNLNVGGTEGRPTVSRKVWLRQPLLDPAGNFPKIEVRAQELLSATAPIRMPLANFGLEVVIVSRHWHGAPTDTHRLLTISVLNTKTATREGLDSSCIFQAGLRVSGLSAGGGWIEAYPEYLSAEFTDEDPMTDENVNRVLYRHNKTFAIGHGCGADWVNGRPSKVDSVWTDVLPVFETPTTSADLTFLDAAGTKKNLRVSMLHLAGLAEKDGLEDLETLLTQYEVWIKDLGSKVQSIPTSHRPTATALIERCRQCAARIQDGIDLLRGTETMSLQVRKAFRLANHAMLMAQLRSRQPLRTPMRDAAGKLSWSHPIPDIDPREPSKAIGYWRPFQIAFLLMSLKGIAVDTHPERETVDLIWFPTGGGKTEAYLGLTAFTVFFNALGGGSSAGVDVLMRYTLRLLTAQQFQRAATLFCAMEHLRKLDVATLGTRPFSIGLWVGGSATPNRRADAIEKLRALQRDPDAENPYVLLRCPWCASKFGPHELHPTRGGGSTRRERRGVQSEVFGYSKERAQGTETVVFRCGDGNCEFGGPPGDRARSLPISVIDEDLLENPPSLVIGTVDKFAMLAWTPAARRIFGLGIDGKHIGNPPTLIIQDELHLISGPLGSMVGAYETVVEALCIDPLGGMIRPKIVASTATISRAAEQVCALYARKSVALFPPAGLDAADSFFAREALDEHGHPVPGRLYAGVLAPAHGSLQTSEARIFATLMQHAALLDGEPADLDPWWTLLVFFNSLRELGGALTLFSADAREYLRVILNRHGLDYAKIRQLFRVEELTSRVRGDHIPRLLEQLEIPLSAREGRANAGAHGPSPIDACLASNIIEVGVDLPRLSLMAIVGQPKTTSQYIQVSSRVGRDSDKPGLVVVIYGQTKPRDRSHYERFRSYHQQLYAQVEPTSVTPFSPPAVERALHGLIVAMTRQLSNSTAGAQSPDPFPLAQGTSLRTRIEETIRERVRLVAPDEERAVLQKLSLRLEQWRAWNPNVYGTFGRQPEDAPLIHPAGSAERPEWRGRSWPTMSSLRNVDASCEADISDAYLPTPEVPK